MTRGITFINVDHQILAIQLDSTAVLQGAPNSRPDTDKHFDDQSTHEVLP